MAKKRKSIKKSRSVSSKPKDNAMASAKKIRLVVGNLILFAILFVLSLVFYYISSAELYLNTFFMLSFVFGFLSLALLISLLVLLFIRVLRR